MQLWTQFGCIATKKVGERQVQRTEVGTNNFHQFGEFCLLVVDSAVVKLSISSSLFLTFMSKHLFNLVFTRGRGGSLISSFESIHQPKRKSWMDMYSSEYLREKVGNRNWNRCDQNFTDLNGP